MNFLVNPINILVDLHELLQLDFRTFRAYLSKIVHLHVKRTVVGMTCCALVRFEFGGMKLEMRKSNDVLIRNVPQHAT